MDLVESISGIHNYQFVQDHLTTVGLSPARVACETCQVLLAGGQVVFLGDLLFLPHLTISA